MAVLLSLMLCALFCTPVFASPDAEEDIAEMLTEAAETLDGTELIPEGAFDGDIDKTADTLMELLSARGLLDSVEAALSGAWSGALTLFLELVGLLLICAVVGKVCDGVGGALGEGAAFISTASVCAAVLVAQIDGIDRIKDAFRGLGTLMGSMIPITGAVWAMGGNVTTASAGSAGLYALLALTERVCAVTAPPVCYVMVMSALCSSLSDGELLSGFTGAVKKLYAFIIAAVGVLLVFSLGAQTSIASAADTAAARGGKLLTQTLIPGVGGAVGDTLRTVAGSVQYVKSVVGMGGVALVGALTLPPLASLLLTRLAFLVTGALASMLGCKREARLLSEMGNVYATLLGALSICAVAFCVALAIFVKTTVAVG